MRKKSPQSNDTVCKKLRHESSVKVRKIDETEQVIKGPERRPQLQGLEVGLRCEVVSLDSSVKKATGNKSRQERLSTTQKYWDVTRRTRHHSNKRSNGANRAAGEVSIGLGLPTGPRSETGNGQRIY